MVKEKKPKKKFGWRQFFPIVLMMLVGGMCGYYAVGIIDSLSYVERSKGGTICSIAALFIEIYLAFYLQIILHEAGHWLFGRMTGYRFSSFRIGSFMWMIRNGKIRLCRLKLVGMGGQCLMSPPEMRDGRIPYILYNMGGSLMNCISAAVFAGIALLTRTTPLVFSFFVLLAGIGIVFALMNGIPMRFDTLNNDGYNALALGKDSEALRSFWIQLKINESCAKGIRIKDMPEEWFTMPSPEAMKNSMIAALGVFACNRMLDEMKFDDASRAMRELLEMNSGIVGLYCSMLTADLIYCELIGENRQKTLEELLDRKQNKFMKAMKSYPPVLRTQYAYALLKEKNTAKAERLKLTFEKVAKKYPYPSDIAGERELMAFAEREYSAFSA